MRCATQARMGEGKGQRCLRASRLENGAAFGFASEDGRGGRVVEGDGLENRIPKGTWVRILPPPLLAPSPMGRGLG